MHVAVNRPSGHASFIVPRNNWFGSKSNKHLPRCHIFCYMVFSRMGICQEMAVLLGLNKFNFFFRSDSGESVESCLSFQDTEIQLVSREWVSSFHCSLTLIQLAFVTRYCRDITTNWWHCCLCNFWRQSETLRITDHLPSLFLMM